MLPPPAETLEITVHDLEALRDAGAEDYRLIDCREDDEWQLCRIDGAELVPLSAFAERTRGWDPSSAENLIIYCHHGMRSLQAAQFMRARGFERTFSLAGGIDAWSAEIDPATPRY